ncbi:MAG: hypothetical protein MZV70_36175 [Desulfobacterales bacterium]|nr:hypothetical protein [Desulfobacterales bacterium]
MYKRGLKYGIGDQKMFSDIQNLLSNEWPEIMRDYTGVGKKGQVGIGNLRG